MGAAIRAALDIGKSTGTSVITLSFSSASGSFMSSTLVNASLSPALLDRSIIAWAKLGSVHWRSTQFFFFLFAGKKLSRKKFSTSQEGFLHWASDAVQSPAASASAAPPQKNMHAEGISLQHRVEMKPHWLCSARALYSPQTFRILQQFCLQGLSFLHQLKSSVVLAATSSAEPSGATDTTAAALSLSMVIADPNTQMLAITRMVCEINLGKKKESNEL
mmetsp:Transcript_27727/g.58999  ORF Transcript_27727/g.58999 Transcript_27727/m.58999 type:complete len:219 (-) Transcript_27727:12-668(-)